MAGPLHIDAPVCWWPDAAAEYAQRVHTPRYRRPGPLLRCAWIPLAFLSAADSSKIRCNGVARISRSAGRARQALICSLSVAFARWKCRATDEAEHRRCVTAKQATSALTGQLLQACGLGISASHTWSTGALLSAHTKPSTQASSPPPARAGQPRLTFHMDHIFKQ